MSQARERRVVAVAAVAGAILLVTGTLLHPMVADPNTPIAAFAEYAADPFWRASHLTQLAGVTLIVAALVSVPRLVIESPGTAASAVASAGAVASLAIAAALQAVDGIALKTMVDRWAAAADPEKGVIFQVAIGVRQVEIGLAAMLSLVMGATFAMYGMALRGTAVHGPWRASLAVLGGVGLLVSGVLTACTGFSSTAMNVSMTSTALLLLWLLALAQRMWQLGSAARSTGKPLA